MSNPIKAIGKAFKSVVRVVKKIALPVLAIGAVVLTGGAALGLLPSVGSVLGSIGISGGLASALTMAAKSAAFGAIGSALTGGNIVKGATAGFVTGGILGGVSAAMGAGKGLGMAASGAGSNGAANGLSVIDNGKMAAMGSGQGLGAQVAQAGLGNTIPTAVQAANPLVSTAPVPSSGGVMGWLNQNPVVGGMVVQGLGQGIMAREQAKDAQRERDQIAANYADTSGLPQYSRQGNDFASAGDVFNAAIYSGKKVTYDSKTGRIQVGA